MMDPLWLLYAVTAILAAGWAASEILSVFTVAPWRALRSRGALFLMVVNAFLASLALAAVLQVAPTAANLFTAIVVGLGWQALVRSQVNLFKPLPGEPSSPGFALPVDQVYERLQRFARRSIDQSLARERIKLLNQALALDVETLTHEVRLLSYGLTELDPTAMAEWLQRMQERDMTDEERKMLLATKLLDAGGVVVLKQLLEEESITAATRPQAAVAGMSSDGKPADEGKPQPSAASKSEPAEAGR